MRKKSKGRVEKFNKNARIVDFRKARKAREKEEKAARKERKRARKEEAARQMASETEQKHHRRISRQKRRRGLLIAGIIIILSLVVGYSAYQIISLKIEQKELKARQVQLKKEKKELQKEMTVVNDPEYIEQQARRQLKLIMPGETLYILPDSDQKKDNNGKN